MESNPSTLVRVGIEGLQLYGYWGLYPEEKKIGRILEIDLAIEYVETDFSAEQPAVNYVEMAEIAQTVTRSSGYILEDATQKILQALTQRWPFAQKIEVCISKIHPPIGTIARRSYVYRVLTF
ncbi:MAG: dihydroneopterin aldolase [Bacteroidia bacterium]